MSYDLFRPWAVRAHLLAVPQTEGAPPKWELWLWPKPGDLVQAEMVGPDDVPLAIYGEGEGDDAAIAYFRGLLESVYDVEDALDPRVWDLAPKL